MVLQILWNDNKVTLNKTKLVETENNLNGGLTSYAKLINDLLGEVKLILTKRLIKDMINGYSILNGSKYSTENGLQNYLVFQPVCRYFKTSANNMVMAWKSNGLSDEITKPPTISDNSLYTRLDYFSNPKFGVVF